jgi:3-hydroxyacyl-[acyl-carrier-protein] dehydratase
MALLDRVECYFPAERRLLATKSVAQSEALLQNRTADDPVFPPVLIIESLAQACGMLMNLEYLRNQGVPVDRLHGAGRAEDVYIPMSVLADSQVRQLRPVRPGDRLALEARITFRRDDMYAFRVAAAVEAQAVAEGEIKLAYPSYAFARH